MMQPISFKSAPNVLIFEINLRNIKLNKTLKFEQEGETVVLDVRGLIYHGNFYFTSCIVGTDGYIIVMDTRIPILIILHMYILCSPITPSHLVLSGLNIE